MYQHRGEKIPAEEKMKVKPGVTTIDDDLTITSLAI
jgi:hypothetical protein